MNKLTIPSLLLGVVMIAGAFAFMPVQEASTVHTTGIIQGTSSVTEAVTTDNSDTGDITFTCGSLSACVVEELYLTIDGTATMTLGTFTLVTNGKSLVIDPAVIPMRTSNVVALVALNPETGSVGNPIVIPDGDVLTLTVTAVAGSTQITTVDVVSSGVITIASTV